MHKIFFAPFNCTKIKIYKKVIELLIQRNASNIYNNINTIIIYSKRKNFKSSICLKKIQPKNWIS